jgi:hypothetical protein
VVDVGSRALKNGVLQRRAPLVEIETRLRFSRCASMPFSLSDEDRLSAAGLFSETPFGSSASPQLADVDDAGGFGEDDEFGDDEDLDEDLEELDDEEFDDDDFEDDDFEDDDDFDDDDDDDDDDLDDDDDE